MQAPPRRRTGLTRPAFAVALSYALSLQLLLVGFAGGQQAARADLGAALGAICAPGSNHALASGGSAPLPSHEPGGAGLCCTLGCGAAPSAALGSHGPSFLASIRPSTGARLILTYDAPALGLVGLRPLGARAPPVVA